MELNLNLKGTLFFASALVFLSWLNDLRLEHGLLEASLTLLALLCVSFIIVSLIDIFFYVLYLILMRIKGE
jgi:glucan phosphoethanolaminetransferase (alkaline phosphatase superfamily)